MWYAVLYRLRSEGDLKRGNVYKHWGKMARPERFELPTFWFVASRSQNLTGLFDVAYEPKRPTPTHAMIPK
jgi:hypothetical protein